MERQHFLLTRTRFAPSPTGQLHLGGARTALFNYLLAKKQKGKFILRVEDTDPKKSQAEYLTSQYQDLLWLGLKPDESPFQAGKYGPYQQSQRVAIYQKHAQDLLNQQKAYRCFCSPEELEQEKQAFLQAQKKANYQYSGQCFQLKPQQIQAFLQEKKPYVVRLKVPQEKVYRWLDLVRGEIIFQSQDIEDFVILRSNGLPLLNFAVTVDDHLMKINQVLRGEEHLANTAKQLALYEALAWKPPQFGHLSLILNSQKQKLSKRDPKTSQFQVISQLRQKGYLASAITNYLLFLGWHPQKGTTEELFDLNQASQNFEIEGLNARGAIFTLKKLNWYNRHYLAQMPNKDFQEEAWKFLALKYQLSPKKKKWVGEIALLFRSQIKCFAELVDLSQYFFQTPANFVMFKEQSELKKSLTEIANWEEKNLREFLRQISQKIWPLIRQKLTGEKSGPELAKILYLLGKKETLKRLS